MKKCCPKKCAAGSFKVQIHGDIALKKDLKANYNIILGWPEI